MSNIDYLSSKMEAMILEIDSICKKNKMEYYLMEEALVTSIRGKAFPHRRKALSIAMHGKDIRKLSRLVRKKQNRALESLLNNPEFPGFYMRYVDTSTLLYDSGRKKQEFANNCIGINIYVLCPYQEYSGTRAKVIEELKRRWAKEMASCFSPIKRSLFVFLSKKAKFAKRFSRMMKRNGEKTNLVEFYSARGDHYIFEKEKFGKARKVKVGRHKFKVPRAMKVVGRAMNGGSLLFGAKNDVNILDKTYIVSFKVSGNDFVETVAQKKLTNQKLISKAKKYFVWKDNHFSPIWNKRAKYYEYYFLTKERFSFYDELCGEMKELIAECLNNKDYTQLSSILKPYIARIRVHQKKGFGLYFDKEIYIAAIITMAYMEIRKEKVKVIAKKNANRFKRILDLIPQEYFKPLDEDSQTIYTTEMAEAVREEIRGRIDLLMDELFEENGF